MNWTPFGAQIGPPNGPCIAIGCWNASGSVPSVQEGLLSAQPAAGNAGAVYVATDTKSIYRDNGSSWDLLSNGNSVSSQWTTAGSNIGFMTGGVGIGTASPGQLLHINGSSPQVEFTGTEVGNKSYYVGESFGTFFFKDITDNVGQWNFRSSTNTDVMVVQAAGNVGIGTTTPTAALQLKAGTAAAGTSPLKLTAGTNLTTPEPGAIEYDGTSLYYTDSTSTRHALGGAGGSTSVTSPITNSGTATSPVIGIQVANTSQAGYLASADWNTFNSKQGTALTNGDLWVGNGSGVATAAAPSGDVTMTNAGAFTVAKIQGSSVTAAAPTTAGQTLRWNGSSYVAAALGTADITGLTTALGNAIQASQMPANCLANETLTFSSPTGSWSCSAITVSGSAFGSQSANLVLAAPNGSAGNPTFRSLVAADIPAISAASITSGTLAVAQGGTGWHFKYTKRKCIDRQCRWQCRYRYQLAWGQT